MSEEKRTDDPIDIEELPQEGNSNARIYPPIDETEPGEDTQGDDDPQQPRTGDASAVREGEDQQGATE